MEEIQIKENIFRIKQMNAIELLSLRPQLSFEDYDSTYNLYNLLLDCHNQMVSIVLKTNASLDVPYEILADTRTETIFYQ